MLHLEQNFVWCWNLDNSESRAEIPGKFLKCGFGEGWKRAVGPIVWEMKKCYKESRRRENICLPARQPARSPASLYYRKFACNNSAFTVQIFTNLIFEDFAKICREKFKFHQNLTRITNTLHEHTCRFMIISRWIFLRVRSFSDKICREKQKTHFMLNKVFPKIVPFLR